MIEQELATIATIVKDTSISFPFIGKKEKERKQLSTQLQSIERSHKTAAQASPWLSTPFTNPGNHCIKICLYP